MLGEGDGDAAEETRGALHQIEMTQGRRIEGSWKEDVGHAGYLSWSVSASLSYS